MTPSHRYGNAVPMETPNRFPQALGNLAQGARFPHSHNGSLTLVRTESTEERKKSVTDVIGLFCYPSIRLRRLGVY